MLWNKAKHNFWAARWIEMKFCRYPGVMRAFYDSFNQVESIFSPKVVILSNNCKYYLEIQRPLIFRCHWYGHKTFELFDLNEDFPKLNFISFLVPKRLRHLVFMQFPWFTNNWWNKQNQETYSAWPLLYNVTFALLKCFNILV